MSTSANHTPNDSASAGFRPNSKAPTEVLPIPLARQIDQVCDRFEESWLAGEEPRIEMFLEAAPEAARTQLVRELLRVELEHRWQRGQELETTEYLARFPEYRNQIEPLLQEMPRSSAAISLGRRASEGGENPSLARRANEDGSAKGPPPLRLPKIPGYEILGVLGQGGMSIVYKARQVSLNRLVALKMILTAAGGWGDAREPRGWARLRAEAEAVAQLRHPNIVQIYEIADHEGQPYLSLELVEGGSLDARLKGTPQSPRQAAALVEVVARAVHSAHLQGIVHRDLKPANILLAHAHGRTRRDAVPTSTGPEVGAGGLDVRDWVPKITDFGLAKHLDSVEAHTQTGAVMGTPSYMAPEQARGHTRTIGPAADVYALGAVLYELLTGRPPFKGATLLDTLEQVRSQEPVPPRRFQPKLPRDVETITLKCLEKEPRRRYTSALDLADDLRAFCEGRPIRARPVSSIEQGIKWARRRPLMASLMTLVFVALSLMTWAWWRAVENGREAGSQKERAENLLVRSCIDRARELGENGDADKAMLWLTHALKIAPARSADLQDAIRANLAAWRRQIHPLREFFDHPAPLQEAAFSPNGRFVLTVTVETPSHTWEMYIWDREKRRRLGPLTHGAEIITTAFSPDSRWIATGCADGWVRIWDAATGRPAREPLPHDGRVWFVVFGQEAATKKRPAGPVFLITASIDKQRKDTLRRWDPVKDRTKPQVKVTPEGGVETLSLSADGVTLITASVKPGNTEKRQLHPLRAVTLLEAPTTATPKHDDVREILHSPQAGSPLFLTKSRQETKGDAVIVVWKNGTQGNTEYLPTSSWVRALAFSPDGKRVLTGGEDHAAQVWDVTDQPKAIGRALQHQDTVRCVAFSPDGRMVATGSDDRMARLWDAHTGRPIGPPLEHQGPVISVAFSVQGDFLLTGSRDGTARLWELAPLRPYDKSFPLNAQVMAVAVSPDGRTLVAGTDRDHAVLWDRSTGQKLDGVLTHDGEVWVVSFSPDGKRIATGSRDRTIRLWDRDENNHVRTLTHSPQVLLCLQPGWAGVTAAVAVAHHEDKFILVRTLMHTHRVRSAAFSPDGRLLVTGSGDTSKGEVRLWEPESVMEAPIFRREMDGVVWQVAFSPDGRYFATSSGESTVQLWDTVKREKVRDLLGHQSRVVALAFSPDGSTLLTGSTDKTARLWDVATGNPIGQPMQHPGAVWSGAFSADGRTVITGGRDEDPVRNGAARLWDAVTGLRIGPPWPHQGVVWAVACQPGSSEVATASADQTVRLWQIPEPLQGSREQIVVWTEVMTGMEMDDDGVIHFLSTDKWKERRRRLKALGGEPGRLAAQKR